MNNWNSLETELRGWEPRRPSPDLQQRIFGGSTPSPALAINLGELWRWLVPALGCFMLVASSFSGRISSPHLAQFASTNFPQPIGREGAPPQTAYLAQSRTSCEMNSVPVTRLEMRFGPGEHPLNSFEGRPTNALIQ